MLKKTSVPQEEVYPPAEDSWLLEECIVREDLRGKKCLDMGCGSGIQSVSLLRAGAEKVFAVDVNSNALEATKLRAQKLGHSAGAIIFLRSDLFSSLAPLEKFDFIAFNPPYVPSEEIKWRDTDGGKKGAEVIEKFVEKVGGRLNKGGVLLLLLSSLNEPEKILARLKKHGFAGDVAARKKLFFEELIVFRAVKA